jgi:localization factor PodJL
MMDELRANLAGGAKTVIAAADPAYDPALFDPKSFDATPFAAPESNFEAPPFAEPVPPFSGDHPGFAPTDAPPLAEQDPFAADSFATGAFAPTGEETADSASENFLAAARRSARAAAEAENNRGSRLGFAWGSPAATAEGAEPQRSRLTVPLIVAIVIVLALFAGVVLSQRLKAGHQAVPAAPQAARNNAPFTPAPLVMPSPASPGIKLPFLGSARPAPAPQPVLPPLPTAKAPAPAPAQGSTQAGAPQLFAPAPKGGPVPTLDRVTQLANSGNPIAETILGLKELDGDGVPANPADAAKWLERAAQQGQAVAQYRLGSVYERGQGVPANPATAVHWYQLAANQGNRKAMHNLAVAFASGAAGKKDMAEAARWFAKAADLGLADSQFNLAVLYERGDGVPQSLLDAYKWYAIATSQGDAESKSRLSVLATQLSDDDRNAAQKSATTFHAATLNHAANMPPEMADLVGN